MEERISKFLNKGLWIVIVLFATRCLIVMPASFYDFFGAAGEAIGLAVICMGVYNTFLWRYNPLEKIPHLMGIYNGYIEYNFSGDIKKKEVRVDIKQTALSVKVKIFTNEITSNTIASNIVKENDEYILYYVYVTSPKSKYSKENPTQYGTCRLLKTNDNELNGIYWTSRQTIGDIELRKQGKG